MLYRAPTIRHAVLRRLRAFFALRLLARRRHETDTDLASLGPYMRRDLGLMD
jgi:hypothetical protein